jgi:hypothetical protein
MREGRVSYVKDAREFLIKLYLRRAIQSNTLPRVADFTTISLRNLRAYAQGKELQGGTLTEPEMERLYSEATKQDGSP